MILDTKKTALIYAVAVFFMALDRFFKIAAYQYQINFEIFDNWFKFAFAPNPHIAFSIPLGGVVLKMLIAVILVALIFILKKMADERDIHLFFLFTLIFSGAVSNFYDRLVYGYVIDYLDLQYFTVFNVADIIIVTGALLALVKIYFFPKLKN